jgi:hypothetical protein
VSVLNMYNSFPCNYSLNNTAEKLFT